MSLFRTRLLPALLLLALTACEAGQLDAVSPGADASSAGVDANLGSDAEQACQPLSDQSFALLTSDGAPTDRPAAEHGDLNLHLRAWEPVQAERGLVDINGDTDLLAPKLNTMFADARIPDVANTYAVHHWDWATNQRAGAIEEPVTTLVGFATTAGETIALPRSGYDIGEGMQARVLYMDDDSITLVYTRSDHVAAGYVLHVVGLCPDPELLRVYRENNDAGRVLLPALRAEQAFGRARGGEVMISIRDTGRFMDPRSRKDWW